MTDAANDNDTSRLPRPCPICGRPAAERLKPFCSKRCADVDLNRWLGGVYAVPGEPVDEDALTEPRESPGG